MAPKPTTLAPIHLEGTTLEGGGQLLRIALGLASLTKKPINITNIRGRRAGGGGLKAQHLTSVQWLGEACNARLSGVGPKSKEITFTPGSHTNLEQGSEVRITQSTPGSINLVLQAVLPYLLLSGPRAPIRLCVTGGTNVSNSPSHEYVAEVLVPMLALIGIPPIEATIQSRGWSQGSTSLGSVMYTIGPLTTKLSAFQLTNRGEIIRVKAVVIAPRDTEQHFRDELDLMFEKRETRFFGASPSSVDVEITFEDSHHEKRYYILLVATTSTGVKLGRDWLYDGGVRPGKTERIVPTMVKRVSDDLLGEIVHGGCVDEYMRDQLVVFQALADGKSRVYGGMTGNAFVPPSLHAQTAMWVAKEIIGVEFDDEGQCEGVGYVPDGSEEVAELASAVDAMGI